MSLFSGMIYWFIIKHEDAINVAFILIPENNIVIMIEFNK